MALDTSIIRQATFQPVQFQMPSQANMLANAAQAVSGLQTLESNRMRMAQMRQEQAREQQVAAGLKQVSAMGESPEMLKAYEDVLLQSGDPKLMDAGMKMRAVRITEARNKQGYETWLRGGQPAAAQPAAAPVDNALALGVETPAEPAAVGSQNMLAQAPAAPADPFAAQRQRFMAGLGSNIPAVVEASKRGLAALPRLEMPKPSEDTVEVKSMKALGLPLTPEGYAKFKSMGQRATPSETEELVLRLQDPNLPPASRKALESRLRILTTREPKEPKDDDTKVVAFRETDAAGNVTFLNKFGQVIKPTEAGGASATIKGKPTATFEKTTERRKQLGLDLDRTITELTDATKKGGLIDQSTGSGAGRLVDIGAGFFGQATPGAIAAGKLAPIADMVLKMVPRFEGPQSDKDTKSYKEAAGQLADSSLPTETRRQAGLEILRLMKQYKGQFVTPEMAAEGVSVGGGAPASAAPAPGAQQPMYARNPTTGQRIMSTDGGNTWTPVR